MSTQSFYDSNCKGTITVENHDVIIHGRIMEKVVNNRIFYFAATPADRRMSFSGSGLPFANAKQAFENSPNHGSLEIDINNTFTIKLALPNSYYASLGTVLIPPTLYIQYNNGKQDRKITIKISDGIPYRMMTYPGAFTMPRRDAQFYSDANLPVRTQEDILRSSGYPSHNKMDKNFWGLKPPV